MIDAVPGLEQQTFVSCSSFRVGSRFVSTRVVSRVSFWIFVSGKSCQSCRACRANFVSCLCFVSRRVSRFVLNLFCVGRVASRVSF